MLLKSFHTKRKLRMKSNIKVDILYMCKIISPAPATQYLATLIILIEAIGHKMLLT